MFNRSDSFVSFCVGVFIGCCFCGFVLSDSIEPREYKAMNELCENSNSSLTRIDMFVESATVICSNGSEFNYKFKERDF